MSWSRFSLSSAILITMLAGAGVFAAHAQSQGEAPNQDSVQNSQDQQDPLKRELPDKERFKQQKQLHQELGTAYKKWLDQDVRWIITDSEKKAFLSLSNDEERDAFIENFWRRRNPNPDSPENEYREEHYRRIAYANEHFAAGKPGWMTDRGMIYIKYGKPDSIDSHPSGGQYERPVDEGGGETSTYPFETWHYRYLDGIGDNIDIEFVDSCMCSDYHMTIDRSEKDALLHVPNGGETLYEQMGMAKKADRFKGGLENLGPGPGSSSNQSKEFDRIELYSKLEAPPEIKFKDLSLAEFLTSKKMLPGPFFPFEVRTDFVKVTDDTVLVPITLQIKNKDITFNTKDGVSKGDVSIVGRISTITDRVVQSFEDPVEAGPYPAVLEGISAAAGAVPDRHRDQGRQQPGSRGRVGAGDHGAAVRRRSPGNVFADSGRQDGAGAIEGYRGGEFHHRQYVCAAAGDDESGIAGELPSESESEFLDAGL